MILYRVCVYCYCVIIIIMLFIAAFGGLGWLGQREDKITVS